MTGYILSFIYADMHVKYNRDRWLFVKHSAESESSAL